MSRFVSGGTIDEPTERDEAWLQAQKALDAKRLQAAEASRQDEGKSLYEKLQENKAAKQEAFEESIRLRNQFRSLDEDEVDFLDAVLQSSRAKEEEVRRQQSEQLDAFRKQQEEVEKAASQQQDGSDSVEASEAWSTNPRKRKKGREGGIGGVKIRRTSTTEQAAESTAAPPNPDTSTTLLEQPSSVSRLEKTNTVVGNETVAPKATAVTAKSPPSTLSLVTYSSDEDD